ncbi:hypothetical protein IQ231_18075 [Cuspidothrix issatschenkoi LEGE 03284]|uniref:hypothetical protein n=1 Tax=Cuspidothrix issatschenkoi TaxID=230752 RepID=UPI001882EC41|nr:hypothetical protein [Cuspidothrix issatschenkoi]MBE9233522.1 hypothetical protein [Cuspidothrix issatschenkoi LEGE 03284]
MSHTLFSDVSIEQQETIVGGADLFLDPLNNVLPFARSFLPNLQNLKDTLLPQFLPGLNIGNLLNNFLL